MHRKKAMFEKHDSQKFVDMVTVMLTYKPPPL